MAPADEARTAVAVQGEQAACQEDGQDQYKKRRLIVGSLLYPKRNQGARGVSPVALVGVSRALGRWPECLPSGSGRCLLGRPGSVARGAS